MDRIRNEEIRGRMKVEYDVVKFIEDKRLIWYGHARRASASKMDRSGNRLEPCGAEKERKAETVMEE
ncbi:hypothetical protein LSTR_LSTR001751 [Laodelphax striatellus]|uniref:Uncharacterized protein n=1 Tax=Laodelphax striatellus TaxID=195883 RepID=A0A482WFM4_LAOST|nr:hypothetical protein LSTR_LSTR001751 [Laodelphax striatellus]